MPDLVRRYDNKNQPIVMPKKGLLASTYFNLVHLKKGQEYQAQVAGIETLYAVLSGNVDLEVNGMLLIVLQNALEESANSRLRTAFSPTKLLL